MELQEVEGQTGITIDMNVSVSAGDMSWTDTDGFTGNTAAGSVIMSGVDMPTISLTGVVLDAGTGTNTSYLQINTGTSNLISGDMTITDLVIGASDTASLQSLGTFKITDVGISFGVIKISGH
jgi:hypothetical protein